MIFTLSVVIQEMETSTLDGRSAFDYQSGQRLSICPRGQTSVVARQVSYAVHTKGVFRGGKAPQT